MAYDKYLFDKYRTVAKLPVDRRKKSRRSLERRVASSERSSEKRKIDNRRKKDRRAINLAIPLQASLGEVIALARSFELPKLCFPNIGIRDKHSLDNHRHIIDWRISIDGGEIGCQTEIFFSEDYTHIYFRQVKGDFQKLEGVINLYEANGKCNLDLSVVVNPGLNSFEAFMGTVFKNKIRDLIKVGLKRVAAVWGLGETEGVDFGFLVHTIPDYFTRTFSDNSYALMPSALSKYLLKNLPPFKCSLVTGIESTLGEKIRGNLIYSPYAPSHFLELERGVLLKHMIDASEIAKDLGAKIIGLGAYTAFVGKRGLDIASAIDMPVTTGTSYTIATALNALEDAALKCRVKFQESTVMVLGATGSIGKVCAELLSGKAARVILVARNVSRLKDLAGRLSEEYPNTKVEYSSDVDASLQQSNLVLISTNTPDTIIDIKRAKPGTIICDISQPRNVPLEDALHREDVLVIDGGVVSPPGKPDYNFYFGLPPTFAFACMAETMILALEKRYESFSIGGNITASKVKEITMLGDKHGFALAHLKSFGQPVSEDRFARIATAAQ